MWGRDLARLGLLLGLLVGSCNCSKADDDPSRTRASNPPPPTTPPITTPKPAVDPDSTAPSADDIADLMDDGDDDDAGSLDISHKTSGSVARVPGDCEPTFHTERERRLDCAGWTIQLSWIAAPTAPADVASAAAAALPSAKRRIISTTRVKGGVVLLVDRPDGSRAYEGWFHRGDKLVYLEARAPRAAFEPISGKLQGVATDFVSRNLRRASKH